MHEREWSQKQRQVQYAIAFGMTNKSQLAKQFDVSRQTIYNWLDDAEFTFEVDRIGQDLKNFGEGIWKANYLKSIQNIIEIANNSPDQRVKLDANKYSVERVAGKIPNHISVSNEDNERKLVSGDILEMEQEKFKQRMLEEYKDK